MPTDGSLKKNVKEKAFTAAYQMDIDFLTLDFDQLGVHRLYDLLALRSRIFVVEQQSIYLDCDGKDLSARHILAYRHNQLIGAARVLPPSADGQPPAIGRVVVDAAYRGRQIGSRILQAAIASCQDYYPGQPIRISAQQHLETFYGSHGFITISQPYLEDGIWHLAMSRPAGE